MGEFCFPLQPVFASSSVSCCCCTRCSAYGLGRDAKSRNANRNKVQRHDVRCVVSVVPYQNVELVTLAWPKAALLLWALNWHRLLVLGMLHVLLC